jgi:hypothetical protein
VVHSVSALEKFDEVKNEKKTIHTTWNNNGPIKLCGQLNILSLISILTSCCTSWFSILVLSARFLEKHLVENALNRAMVTVLKLL